MTDQKGSEPLERTDAEDLADERESSRRNRSDAKYSVSLNADKVTIPPFCTCCMKPAAAVEPISVSASQKSEDKTVTRTVSINFPICSACLAHRKKAKRANWLLFGLSALIAMASVFLFAAVLPAAEITFWILPILVAAASYLLLGLLFRLPKLGGAHSALQNSVWISGVNMQDNTVLYTFTNWKYANLFAKANAAQLSDQAEETPRVIEEPYKNRTKYRSFFRASEHFAGIGALTLVFTAALLFLFGNNLTALSASVFAAPAAVPVSSAVSSVPHSLPASSVVSSVPASSVPASSVAASSKASSASASSKTSSSKASSVRSSSAASSKASSAVSSAIDEVAQRKSVIKETLATIKSELTAMEQKLRDYEARLDKLWAQYTDSKDTAYLNQYRTLYDEYDKYYQLYDWKVDYYNSLVEQYNSFNSEG